MKKFLLAAAVALMGFSGASAATQTLEPGHLYKLQNVSLPQFYFGVDANAVAGKTVGALVAEDEAATLYFSVNPDNANQYLLRLDNEEGAIIGANAWWVAVDTDDSHFWTVNYDTNIESEYPVVNFQQTFSSAKGYMGADYATKQADNTDVVLYCDKAANFNVNWYAIDVTPATEPTPDPDTVTGTQVTNATVETAFTDGAIVALQCLDTNGGSYYYFNGDQVKNENLAASNFFKVVRLDNGNFVFQNVENETYVGRAGAASNANVTAEDAIEDAMQFTGASVVEAGGWTTIADGVVNGVNTIRFTTNNGMFLNTNNTALVPKWFTGTGGFSVWYAFTFTDAEVKAFIPNYGVEAVYTVTCNFVCNGEVVATSTAKGHPGTPYTFRAPQYYATEDGEPVTGEFGKADETISVKVIESLPFRASASVANAQYQAVMQHSSQSLNAPYTWTYNDDEEIVEGVTTAKASLTPYAETQMFAFIGNLKDGFKVYSKAAEAYLMKDGSTTVMANEADATVWTLAKSATNTADNYFCLINGTQYINLQHLSNGVGQLMYWGQADQGSTIWCAGVSQPIINYYTDFFTQAANLAGDDPEATAAIEHAQGIIATLDPYAELTEADLAEVAAIKAQLEMMVQAVAKKNDLAKYYNASYLGAAAYEEDTELLYVATTTEEIETAYQTLLADAKTYFINSFKEGALLKNNRSNKYIGYKHTEVEDPDDDENIIVTTEYAKFVNPVIEAYFTAEEVEDGLVLRNVVSNTYLGIQTANSNNVPAVEDVEEAAIYEVVTGTNGFEFLCINSNTDNNYINTDGGAGALVVWNYANDGGAFWTAAALPLFGEDETVEVAVSGDTKEGVEGIISINAITVTVSDQAVATVLASVKVVNAEGVVVAEAAIEGEGEEGVFTVTLAEPVKVAGTYTVKIPVGAFLIDAEDVYAYSPAKDTVVVVGETSSISEINAAEAGAAIYDLQGRRVATPARGLYIINGVKVVK